MGVPVQTSVGRPWFRLDYELHEQVRELMPRGLLKLEGDVFRKAYIAQLDKLDLDALRAQFEAIQKRHDGKRPVLLCFEDVHAGEFCHRRVFADWWKERTGRLVREVGAGGTVILERDPHHVVLPGGPRQLDLANGQNRNMSSGQLDERSGRPRKEQGE